MKKYNKPSVEIVELDSETLMDILVSSTAADPKGAFGNGHKPFFGGFGNPFETNAFE